MSVSVNSNVIKTETLTGNAHVALELVQSDFYGTTVIFTVTPKNADSTHLTFNFCPVYELGTILNVYNTEDNSTDVYKAYFNLTADSTELAFTDPLDDNFFNLDGYPITLTIGNDEPVVWEAAYDISYVTTTQKGDVLFTFEFGNKTATNLYMQISDANSLSNAESDIVLGDTIFVYAENMFDGLTLTFIPEESGTYVITITGDKGATVNVEDNSSAETFFASEYDGVITLKLEANVIYTFTFSTSETEDEYTAVVTKGADKPDDPEDADITLGESFEVTLEGIIDMKILTFYADEVGTYIVTIDSETAKVNWLDSVSSGDGKYVFEIEVEEANKLVTLYFTTTGEGETFNVTVTKKAS